MKYREQSKIIKQIRKAVSGDFRFKNHKIELGYKYRNGIRTDELSVRVLVPKKKPKSELDNELIPSTIMGLPTDVIEVVFQKECDEQPPKNYFSKIKGGIEIKNSRFINSQGTVGCVVLKNNIPFALTCHHVIYGENHQAINGKISQPGKGTNYFGEAIDDARYYSHELDTAIFQIFDRDYDMENSVNGICGLIKRNKNPGIGDKVFKYGRTTKFTSGIICGVCIDNRDFTIERLPSDTNRLSKKGDSGSLWLTKIGNDLIGVGLHYEGDRKEGKSSKAMRLTTIFRKFNLKHISQPI